MNKKVLSVALSAAMVASLPVAMNVQAAEDDLIVVGYAQVGAESDWRTANTESFKSTFT